MILESLDNLVRINQLKREPSDQREFEGLVKAAIDRLKDAQNETLAFSSRFDLAYSAAHGLALSALRAAGYRSDKRYLVFQCLIHTVNITQADVKILSLCHERRNLAEYQGHLDVDEALLAALIATTKGLLVLVEEKRM